MRKRIVIAVLAIVVVLGVALIVTSPKKGSLEWHKDKYFGAQPGLFDLDLIRQLLGRRPQGRIVTEEEKAREKFHESVLIRLGYLEELLVVVSNVQPVNVVNAAAVTIAAATAKYVRYELVGTNTIRIVTIKEDAGARMPQWEQAIRKLDVPPDD